MNSNLGLTWDRTGVSSIIATWASASAAVTMAMMEAATFLWVGPVLVLLAAVLAVIVAVLRSDRLPRIVVHDSERTFLEYPTNDPGAADNHLVELTRTDQI